MHIVPNNIEARMLEIIKPLKGDIGGNYALHFHLSELQEEYKSEFQQRIAVNILNDIFRFSEGFILVSKDGDIFVIYHGDEKSLLDKAIFQLRYLFVDDPLANNSNGEENEDFCTLYVLSFQWRAFHRLCSERLAIVSQGEQSHQKTPIKDKKGKLTPSRLVDIERELETIDIEYALRQQPICAIKKNKPIRHVYNEVYINIGHLRRLLDTDCNLGSDRWLFNYITESLDRYVIDILPKRKNNYLQKPISINLNINTIFLPEFEKFCDKVINKNKISIVLELQVFDIFSDMHAFIEAKKLAQSYGCKICIDGLTNESFVHVNRKSLGFDLAKLQWNADMEGDLNSAKNKVLAKAIDRCGSNRMILCRCDSEHAIDYGHALGISLFQGRYPDRVLDPGSLVVN